MNTVDLEKLKQRMKKTNLTLQVEEVIEENGTLYFFNKRGQVAMMMTVEVYNQLMEAEARPRTPLRFKTDEERAEYERANSGTPKAETYFIG